MNAHRVRRVERRTDGVQSPRAGSCRGSGALRGRIIRSGYQALSYPDRREKGLPPLQFSAAEDPEPGEGYASRYHAGGSRQAATGRILIVEDDADLCETLADILQYEGYRVETAGNGQEAWARLTAEPRPALVLLDLMMPVMDGWEFRARQLRDPRLGSIPVVLISAAEGIRQQAALLSASSYLAKPIDVGRLIEVVSRFVS